MYLSVYRPAVLRSASGPSWGQLFDSFLNDFAGSVAPEAQATVAPRFDLVEKAESFEAQVELPGISKEDIELEVEGTRVSLRAQAKSETLAEGERRLYSERSARLFARTFELPVEVDSDRAQARFENGILKLVLPKKDVVKAKRLQIQ